MTTAVKPQEEAELERTLLRLVRFSRYSPEDPAEPGWGDSLIEEDLVHSLDLRLAKLASRASRSYTEPSGAERTRVEPSERTRADPSGPELVTVTSGEALPRPHVPELGNMSKAHVLRGLVNRRLTAAAQEICGLLEGAMSEYEEELGALKEENQRNRKLLHAVLYPEVQVQRAEDPEPPQIKEDQEDPEPPHIKEDQEDPEPPHIKEEQEDLWTNQEGEQLPGLQEAGLRFSVPPVKREDDEEEAQSSQLHQRQTEPMETEADGAHRGGPEPDRRLDPESDPGPDTDETEYSDDWEEPQEPPLNPLLNKEGAVGDVDCSPGTTSSSSPACAASVDHQGPLEKPSSSKTGEKPFKCSLCDKRYRFKSDLKRHMAVHTGEKRAQCSVCGKRFRVKNDLKRHMAVHTGEKLYSCSVCSKTFTRESNRDYHMTFHTGKKPVECSLCNKSYRFNSNLKRHMTVHTGEKPFSCSLCSKTFNQKGHLNDHMPHHTGEKPFGCSVCGKAFAHKQTLKRHLTIHTRGTK